MFHLMNRSARQASYFATGWSRSRVPVRELPWGTGIRGITRKSAIIWHRNNRAEAPHSPYKICPAYFTSRPMGLALSPWRNDATSSHVYETYCERIPTARLFGEISNIEHRYTKYLRGLAMNMRRKKNPPPSLLFLGTLQSWISTFESIATWDLFCVYCNRTRITTRWSQTCKEKRLFLSILFGCSKINIAFITAYSFLYSRRNSSYVHPTSEFVLNIPRTGHIPKKLRSASWCC